MMLTRIQAISYRLLLLKQITLWIEESLHMRWNISWVQFTDREETDFLSKQQTYKAEI